MAWNDAPPTKQELNTIPNSDWASTPPTKEEILESSKKEGSNIGNLITNSISELANQPLKLPGEVMDPNQFIPGLMAGLKKIDEYTGAPIRKFTTGLISGQPQDHAPSGAEQAKMLGVPTTTYGEKYGVPSYLGGNVAPSDVAGFGLEVVQDPLMLAQGLMKVGGKLMPIIKEAPEAMKGILSAEGGQTAKGFGEGAASANAESLAKTGVQLDSGKTAIENNGMLFQKTQPKNLEELNHVELPNDSGKLASYDRMKDIEKIVPDLTVRPLNYHYEMLKNPEAMKELKLEYQNLPSESSKKIAAYNQAMVSEARDKIKGTVNEITGHDPISLSDQGENIINDVKNKYIQEKDSLGPMFQKIKETSTPLNAQEAKDFQIALANNTKMDALLKVEKNGSIGFLPYSPKYGLSSNEYNQLKKVMTDFNGPMSFKDIQNSRDYLRKLIDPSNPKATEELSKARSFMLDQLEEMANKNSDMRDVFSNYAKNERTREQFESIMGGKVDSLDAMFRANPDKVVKKILSNPNYVQITENYLGKDKTKDLIQSYLSDGLEKSFSDVKGFKPHEVQNWLTKNKQFVDRYLDKDVSERISALADYGYQAKRFMDQVNPSGTAASLLKGIEPIGFAQKVTHSGPVAAITSEISSKLGASAKQKQAVNVFNKYMSNASISEKRSVFKELKNTLGDYLKDVNFEDIMKADITARALKNVSTQQNNKE